MYLHSLDEERRQLLLSPGPGVSAAMQSLSLLTVVYMESVHIKTIPLCVPAKADLLENSVKHRTIVSIILLTVVIIGDV